MSSTEPGTPDTTDGRRISVEILAGLCLAAIASVFLLRAGEGNLDWLFPISLGRALVAIGIVLVIRGAIGRGETVPIVPPLLRGHGTDVAVFTVLAVVFVVTMRPVGFWVVSPLLVFVASVYLSDRTRREIVVSAVVSIALAIVGWLILTQVFFVPLPRARWLPF